MPHPIPYVAIIDVGHGNCTVLRDKTETIIIDCGARGSGLLEFLKREGINSIDYVFLSHADQDHIGGLLALISTAEFTINRIFVNSDASKGSALWGDMAYELSILNENGIIKSSVGISRSDDIFKCGSISLKVIGPTTHLALKGAGGLDKKERTITSNSISASFQIFWNENNIAYLAGDIDQIGLDDLVLHNVSFLSPLLVFPHHGGKSDHFDIVAFAIQLCNLVKPETVIFSIGRNKYSNPRPEVIDAVRRTIKDVRVSCTQLSKNCAKILPTKLSDHLVDMFSKGIEKNECCSGTFLIKLGEDIKHFPEKTSHQKFISNSAPNSLCS